MIDKKLRSYVVSILRRASYKFKPRNSVFVSARRGRGLYQCSKCGKIFARQDVALDHVVPVVGKEGFTTFDDFIERLFVPESGWQVLCNNGFNSCHSKKTQEEQTGRYEHKNSKIKKKRRK